MHGSLEYWRRISQTVSVKVSFKMAAYQMHDGFILWKVPQFCRKRIQPRFTQ